ncbi:ATP-dependent Clp protease adapter protein ClpS [Ktedonobacter sp. SOSP1-85]|jgi:ATP-dependent Clp protease adaptor protein ClpS|uniref:ATP-dependent Clp protease adaptor protein ClpS n=1 Tax=Ktedonobacter racemifer DSM 44963 TaxID=485913 RepID=D6TM69_KTERA|nr:MULTISPECIES: ATP-dependent Clp protease adaptor ClpS [Ktedonobacter]EFH86869.1 ATP-dependent Clp protease adaptor protein ClpS [Ktedonobacter racemifer DSM 44963]GHO75866.1 ATP-dependent Clp protease adapter protein ClpS [Ktedonobacter sp. SOSP1-85]
MAQRQCQPSRLEIRPEEVVRQRSSLLPLYKVILFNDDYNDMLHVVAALLETVNTLTMQEATHIMLTAHLNGNAIVIVCPHELAEHYQERLLGYALTVTIEPE